MGTIHNALKRGPWTIAANAILGETREGSGIERLGESMTPTLDLWSRPDWLLYSREQLVYLHAQVANVAAEFGAGVFEAPPIVNGLLVVDRIEIGGLVAAATFFIGYDARPAGSVEVTTNKDFLDQRCRPNPAARPKSRVFTDTNAATALTGPSFRTTCAANVINTIEGPFILLGNNLALIVEHAVVNIPFNVSVFGRERQLLPSEVRAL